MSWFALGWAVALATVFYADAVEGGCRGHLQLVGPPRGAALEAPVAQVDGVDPSELDVRRWQRRRRGSW
jgi:hypothetical protein